MSPLSCSPELRERIVGWRRTIHQNPEPGFHEEKTAQLIESALKKIGKFAVRRVGTGVLADLGKGPAVLLRADMDALELEEQTGLPFASKVPGLMHACGHDAHVAMLLGAAALLAERAAELKHAVRLVFQPAEESHPGGALRMIDAGALENVQAAFAQHVYPQEPVGSITLKSGAIMANADDFNLRFIGRSGHAAFPHLAGDAALAAGEFVARVQKIVSRNVDPFHSVVITIGKIVAGTRRNVIAGEALLEGTARTLNDELRRSVAALIERTAKSVALEMDLQYEFEYFAGYPVVFNNPQQTAYVVDVATRLLGEDKVLTLEYPSMGGEDFAYIAKQVPSCFFRLGSGGKDPATRFMHHNAHFTIDEECLPIGARLMASLALEWRPKP